MIRSTGIRGYFTLIEMMLVVLLIGTCSLVVGLKTHQLVQTSRFESDCKLLVQKFRFAQEAMLNLRADLIIRLELTDQGLVGRFEGDAGTLQALQLTHRLTFHLQSIDTMEFAGNSLRQLVLPFASSGGRMGCGLLKLGGGGDLATWVHFPGYPSLLHLQSTPLLPEPISPEEYPFSEVSV